MHNQINTTTNLIDEKTNTNHNNLHHDNNNTKQNNILHTTITTTSTALELHDNVHLKNAQNPQENEKNVDLTINSSCLTPNLNDKPTKVFMNDGQMNPRILEKSNKYKLPHLKLNLKNNYYNHNNHLNNNNNINNDIKSHKNATNNGLGSYGLYRNTISLGQDDKCKLYTIYGNDNGDNEKLSELPPSATGSLSSIITTSIASSEPEPGVVRKGGGGSGPGSPHDDSKSLSGNNGADEKSSLNRPGIKQEKWITILMQVSIPFFLAGIGTIGAGIVLGRVEKWRVFDSVSELFILVPALLGLKGNLDMCLASRLSTQVNLGNMTLKKEVTSMIVGNIALVQVQAIVASFLVALFALFVGGFINGEFSFPNVMLLIASSMFTATSSCFVLDFVLVAVILLSQKYNINPDNMATPLAASIGDVVSISVFSFIASILYDNLTTHLWVTFIIVACYALLLPIWVVIVLKNRYTRPVLKTGWVPVLTALCISGISGLVLDAAEKIFDGFVVFQPIINGIGGNLVSVHASKISTMLHQSSILGIIPPHTKIFEWPWRALFKGVPYAKTARILLAMSIPGNILFIFAADYIHMSQSTIGAIFVVIYVVTSFVQVMLLLYIAHIIVHSMWKWKVDPDSASIPYLTSLGDLFGTSMLAVAFFLLVALNQEYGKDLSQLNAT